MRHRFAKKTTHALRFGMMIVACALAVATTSLAAADGAAQEGSADAPAIPVPSGVATAVGTSAGSTPDAPDAPDFRLADFDFADANIDMRFFEREPLGFDDKTFEMLADELASGAKRAYDYVIGPDAASPAELALQLLPSAVVFLFLLLGAYQDRRIRREHGPRLIERLSRVGATGDGGGEAADPKVLEDADSADEGRQRPWLARILTWARDALLYVVVATFVPIVGLALSYFPLRGLFPDARWTSVLSDALLVLVIYRLCSSLLRSCLGDSDDSDVATRARRTLRRAARRMLATIGITLVLAQSARDLAAPADVIALCDFAFRLSCAAAGVRLASLRREILVLLPSGGGRRYQIARLVAHRYLGALLAFWVLLLLLWAFGFQRAATTVLLRSYAVIGVLLLSGLALRFLERSEDESVDAESLRGRFIDSFDAPTRLAGGLLLGLLLFEIAGVLSPITRLLDIPLVYVGDVAVSIFTLARAFVVGVVAVLIARYARILLEYALTRKFEIDLGATFAITTIVYYALLVVGLTIALLTLGLDFSALAIFAGALGVGIGFGLQDIARNLISGLILLLGRSVEKGDYVTVGGAHYGRVEDVGARSVTVRTPSNHELVIPSSELVNGTIMNWTHSDPTVRILIPVGVSYGADVRQVEEALLTAARRSECVLKMPRPDVWLQEFGDSSVNFGLLVWIDARRHTESAAIGKTMFHVWDVLAEEGIEIPFPQRDLHLKTVPPTWVAKTGSEDTGSEDAE